MPNGTLVVDDENRSFVISNVIISQGCKTFTAMDITNEISKFDWHTPKPQIESILKSWRDNGLINDLGGKFELCL